jgi:hypothetical protein
MFGYPYLLKSIINDIRMLKMVVRKKVELVQEVADVDATEWVHLGKWQDTGEAYTISKILLDVKMSILHELPSRLVWSKPTDIDNFIVLVQITDRHWHIIVC